MIIDGFKGSYMLELYVINPQIVIFKFQFVYRLTQIHVS